MFKRWPELDESRVGKLFCVKIHSKDRLLRKDLWKLIAPLKCGKDLWKLIAPLQMHSTAHRLRAGKESVLGWSVVSRYGLGSITLSHSLFTAALVFI